MMDGVSYQLPNTCPDPAHHRQGSLDSSNVTKGLLKPQTAGTATAVVLITRGHLVCKHQSGHRLVHVELNRGSAAAPATPCPGMGESNILRPFRFRA